MIQKHPIRWFAAFLLVVGLLVYGRSVRLGYVFDDHEMIEKNPSYHSWTFAPRFFVNSVWQLTRGNWTGGIYRPVQVFSHFLDYQVTSHPWFHHFVSVILHLGNTLLLFFLLTRWTTSRGLALSLAFLFLIHPGISEAVYYIAARNELLYVFFFLGTLCMVEWESRGTLILAPFLYLLCLLSKESGLILLPALVLYVHRKVHAPERKRGLYLGFLAACVLMYLGRHASGVAPHLSEIVSGVFHKDFWLVLVKYGELLLLPFSPLGFRDRFLFTPHFLAWSVSILALLGVAASVRTPHKDRTIVEVSLLILIPVLLLSSSVSFSFEYFSDRYLYGAVLGLVMLVAGIRWRADWMRRVILSVAVYSLILLPFTVVAATQWKNDLSFWLFAVKANRESPVAYRGAAVAYLAMKDVPTAEAYVQKALEIGRSHPYYREYYADALTTQALIFEVKKEKELALETYVQALHVNPGMEKVWQIVMNLLQNAHRCDDFLRFQKVASEAYPWARNMTCTQ